MGASEEIDALAAYCDDSRVGVLGEELAGTPNQVRRQTTGETAIGCQDHQAMRSNLAPLKEGFVRFLPVGILVALVMAGELLAVLWTRDRFGESVFQAPVPHEAGYSNTAAIGEWLYTQFLLPFEVAGIILLVAIVAAVALTLRKRKDSRTQIPAHQVRVKRDERVRLVKLKSEPETGRGD